MHDLYLAHVRALCDLSLRRLPALLDHRSGLFVLRADGEHLRPSSLSVRQSAFAALGLERAEDVGFTSSVDIGAILTAIDAARPRIDNSGDLGLVLWAAARRDRKIAEHVLADLLGFGTLAARRGDSSYASMELAWVVTGLAEALANDIGPDREVRARLDAAYRLLLQNRGTSGLMSFARWERGGGIRARLEGVFGFFDAQAYTVLASLKRDAVIHDSEARDVAMTLGRHLLRQQRSLGRWPWQYNVTTGEVVDLYPIYSVHQDAMAPAALLALERAQGLATTAAVAKGVAWVFGDNELGVSLADPDRSVIWRSIRRKQPLSHVVYPLKVASLLGASPKLGESLASPQMLEIDREVRPYHLGLTLYAFAELAASSRRATHEKPAA